MTQHITQKFNPQNHQAIDVGSLISAPLVAAINANSMMLKAQTQFLMDFCFTKKGSRYDPVMIEMSLSRTVIKPSDNPHEPSSMQTIQSTFKVPLMTLVPLNALAVDRISMRFNMELSTQTNFVPTIDADDKTPLLNDKKQGQPKVAQLQGKISYDHQEKQPDNRSQNSSQLRVDVQANTLPLPLGVSALLDMYSKAIHTLPPKERLANKPKTNNE